MPRTDSQSERQAALQAWALSSLKSLGLEAKGELRSVSDDASFRRYFRINHSAGSLICVDAPPDKENNEAFVHVQQLLESGAVNVPSVMAKDFTRGFLLLSDLGDELLLSRLSESELSIQETHYRTALATLSSLVRVDAPSLPVYDEAKLREEMQLFPDWLVEKQLGVVLSDADCRQLDGVMNIMIENALGQPQVFVHRDFHARNLLLVENGELGVIDFQDAVRGPVTYDLVSLLKDCYWHLPRSTVLTLVEESRQQLAASVSPEQFIRWFDLMGFQRHLKCAGIFSRLNLRDGKPGYLKDIPLVINYLVEVAKLYPELRTFAAWLESSILPGVTRLSQP